MVSLACPIPGQRAQVTPSSLDQSGSPAGEGLGREGAVALGGRWRWVGGAAFAAQIPRSFEPSYSPSFREVDLEVDHFRKVNLL